MGGGWWWWCYLVELSLGGVLEDEVDAVLVVEVAVEAQDVVVPQVRLDLRSQAPALSSTSTRTVHDPSRKAQLGDQKCKNMERCR